MVDERLKTLAKNLVNYSCSLKKGENILIEAMDTDEEFLCELVKEFKTPLYVMDKNNYNDVMSMAKTNDDKDKVCYILNEAYPGENRYVKDPYYGGQSGFETVFNQLDEACEALCKRLLNERN